MPVSILRDMDMEEEYGLLLLGKSRKEPRLQSLTTSMIVGGCKGYALLERCDSVHDMTVFIVIMPQTASSMN